MSFIQTQLIRGMSRNSTSRNAKARSSLPAIDRSFGSHRPEARQPRLHGEMQETFGRSKRLPDILPTYLESLASSSGKKEQKKRKRSTCAKRLLKICVLTLKGERSFCTFPVYVSEISIILSRTYLTRARASPRIRARRSARCSSKSCAIFHTGLSQISVNGPMLRATIRRRSRAKEREIDSDGRYALARTLYASRKLGKNSRVSCNWKSIDHVDRSVREAWFASTPHLPLFI